MAVWNEVQYSNINLDRFDAEYFRKDFEENLSFLQKTGSCRRLGTLFSYIKRGSQPKYNENGTIRVLRSVNVGFMNFNKTRQEYVTQQFLNTNARGGVEKNDILVTSTGVGTLGRTSIWHFDKPAYCDGHITILRNGVVDPFMVTAFLNSKYGLKQFDQNYRGSSGQIEIYPFDISKFLIPEILFEYEKEIGGFLRKAFKLQEKSKMIYNKANELLDKALGLNDIQFKNEKSYTTSFSEIVGGSNTSSYFYQPKYTKLDRLINKFENVKLRSLIKEFSTGFAFTKEQLQKDENSSLLLKIGNLKEMDIDLSSTDYVNKKGEIAGSNEKVNIGNILIGMSGSVGVASVIRENINAFVNQRILRLDVEDTIDPEYLALVINSLVGKLQFEKYATGGVQLNISPRDILRFSIPRLGKIEEEISQLSLKSYRYKQLSKYLLEQAIQEVESLIEKAAERL